ncbi:MULTISPECIES: isoprenylcysteine carboxylmethyltransferase family protein [unclassified Vibrio]|uniref:Isoprenylcysteine carboxylmethyltransferase family protein n=1 Tax=Vibrio sp. HB236076 TaxID=3232307 RepID=A0AB39HKG6_9VIBR|nr:isoprenylcysteine carboxylmethyltransferase family protein [Vibrio sp. HB161653]MDP5253043.1 isoprenylcysteine carboxylmethyltransferase family protein [Vibrio sp. HB161653]
MNQGNEKPTFAITRLALLIPPPVLLLICAAIAYGLSHIKGLSWAMPRQTLVAVVTLIFAVTIAIAALIPFIKHKTTINPHHIERTRYLIEDGIYAHSRNPMYLSLALILFAYSYTLSSPLSLLSCFVFVAYLNTFQIAPEEALLKQKFGDQYQAYCARVRRWC